MVEITTGKSASSRQYAKLTRSRPRVTSASRFPMSSGSWVRWRLVQQLLPTSVRARDAKCRSPGVSYVIDVTKWRSGNNEQLFIEARKKIAQMCTHLFRQTIDVGDTRMIAQLQPLPLLFDRRRARLGP